MHDGEWVGSTVGVLVFCFQAEDGIRDLVRSRGLGDVYKRQGTATFGLVALIHGGAVVPSLTTRYMCAPISATSLSLIHI